MKTALAIVILAAIVLAGTAFAQVPVRPVDMRADFCVWHFPDPGTITIAFYFTIYSIEGASAYHESGVTIKLDNTVVLSQSVNFSATSNDCAYDPNCTIPCQISASGGTPTWDNCSMWSTWLAGGACDPQNPVLTCQSIYYCACGAQFVVIYNGSYEQQGTMTAEVDGPIYPGVDEADETNNMVYYSLAPVSVEPTTWGKIKALYR